MIVLLEPVFGSDKYKSNLIRKQHICVYIQVCMYLCRYMRAKSCPTLCNPTDYSLPGSSVCETLQAGILQWVAMPFFSRESSQAVIKPTSHISCVGHRFFTPSSNQEAHILVPITKPQENQLWMQGTISWHKRQSTDSLQTFLTLGSW